MKCPKFKCNTVSVSFSACRCSSVVFSSKVGREENKSLETVLRMSICGCGLPVRCCQPAVAGGFIYADLRGELSTYLAPQALFSQSSPGCKPLLQAFPFPSTLGVVTMHPLSQACMLVYSSCGRWVFPLSCRVFLPLPLSQAFLLLVVGRSCPCLLTVPGEIPLPRSLALRVPHPLCYVSLLFLLLITQFLVFPRLEVSLSRGLCFSGPGLSVGVPCTA
jgi:hypothetical protein